MKQKARTVRFKFKNCKFKNKLEYFFHLDLKVCYRDEYPAILTCPRLTGVTIISVQTKFVSKYGAFECETNTNYSVNELAIDLQNYCNKQSDRSQCVLEKSYSDTLFQVHAVTDMYNQIPVRFDVKYDCLGKV